MTIEINGDLQEGVITSHVINIGVLQVLFTGMNGYPVISLLESTKESWSVVTECSVILVQKLGFKILVDFVVVHIPETV